MFEFTEQDLLPKASPEELKSNINSYDMFAYYIGPVKIGRKIRSPIKEERIPSFALFVRDGEVLFNDFRLGGGDIIRFVQLKFNLDYRDAINRLVQDAGLSHKFNTNFRHTAKPVIKYNTPIEYTKPTISIKARKWTNRDKLFWESFLITKEVLDAYRVVPISHFFINNKIIKAESHAYAFKEFKDSIWSYTIYQPFSTRMKWIKSHDVSVFYGWDNLPDTGDNLLITKSLKDVMVISSLTDIPTTALQSEKVKPKASVVKELKGRFKEIYLLYDNDYDNVSRNKPNYGREFGAKIAKEFDLKQIEIPDTFARKYDAKDISDLAKNAGKTFVDIILSRNLNSFLI